MQSLVYKAFLWTPANGLTSTATPSNLALRYRINETNVSPYGPMFAYRSAREALDYRDSLGCSTAQVWECSAGNTRECYQVLDLALACNKEVEDFWKMDPNDRYHLDPLVLLTPPPGIVVCDTIKPIRRIAHAPVSKAG
jgi:hypothetical protein